VGRPPSLTNRYTAGKSVPMIPSIKRPATSGAGAGAGAGAGSESPMPNRREQRRSVDLGSSLRGRRTSPSPNDEINTLQVESESIFSLQKKGLMTEMPNPCTWRERILILATQ